MFAASVVIMTTCISFMKRDWWNMERKRHLSNLRRRKGERDRVKVLNNFQRVERKVFSWHDTPWHDEFMVDSQSVLKFMSNVERIQKCENFCWHKRKSLLFYDFFVCICHQNFRNSFLKRRFKFEKLSQVSLSWKAWKSTPGVVGMRESTKTQ